MSPSTSPPIETEKGDDRNGLSPADQLALLALQQAQGRLLGRANLPEISQRRAHFRAVRRFFGLDIHRDYLVATAVDRELQVVYGPRRVAWKHLVEWAPKTVNALDAVVVEMTTNTWEVHDVLSPHVPSVTVVHPPHVKLITQMPVMNDKKAAESLAILHAAGLLRGVWVPPQAVRDWRCLVAQRHDRVTAATQAKNRLHAILFRHQIEKPKASLPFSTKRRDFWLSLPVSPVEKLAIELDLEIIDQAEAQKAKLEKLMTETVLADERLPYLVQLPGVSTLGALTILAAIGTIERFPSAKKLVGYAGLGSRVHDSGQKRSTGKITKSGRKDLRHAMVTAASIAAETHPHWKAELARLAPRIGRNKAIVAIARKLLVVVWHVLTKKEADRHANESQVASGFLYVAYGDVGARNLPDGMTAPEFVRRNLDALGLGKELQRVRYGKHEYLLPQSSLPGAPPMARPNGRGQVQNTREAKLKRAEEAAKKRAELEAKRKEAEARRGRPRKTRADKGTRRGPNKVTKDKLKQAEVAAK